MNIELNKEVEDAVIENPMKYRIMTAPNVNNGSIECLDYAVTDKGVTFWYEDEGNAGFIPYGSFGVILPL
jgi:hypothetical protein